MDDGAAPDGLIRAEYRYLSRLNRVSRTAELALEEIRRRVPRASAESIRIIDFGSGGGDVPRRMTELAADFGLRATVFASDRSDVALHHHRAVGEGTEFVAADVREAAESVPSRSMDVAHASLVLHHLSDEDVVRALRSMAAVSRELVLWNDLIRDRLGEIGAFLASALSRREIRSDAVTSVRRGFSIGEAIAAAEAAGLVDIEARRIRAGRFLLSGRPGPAPSSRPTVRATSLCVTYGSHRVLDRLGFSAHSGEVVVVRGPNGCGKSTLLACLARALRPAGGKVWVDPGLGIVGFHPQEGGLLLELDARSNLDFFAGQCGLRGERKARSVQTEMARWGLAGIAEKPVSQLSGGLRRRAALASCFAHEPRFIVLDEPDAGLDAAGRALLSARIRRTVEAGGTAVMSSHSESWIEEEFPISRIVRM